MVLSRTWPVFRGRPGRPCDINHRDLPKPAGGAPRQLEGVSAGFNILNALISGSGLRRPPVDGQCPGRPLNFSDRRRGQAVGGSRFGGRAVFGQAQVRSQTRALGAISTAWQGRCSSFFGSSNSPAGCPGVGTGCRARETCIMPDPIPVGWHGCAGRGSGLLRGLRGRPEVRSAARIARLDRCRGSDRNRHRERTGSPAPPPNQG